MKSINVRQLQRSIRACVDRSQKEPIVVTRYGKPAMILTGVEGKDWETVLLQSDAAFWTMIQKRRKSKLISMAEMRRRIGSRKGTRDQ